MAHATCPACGTGLSIETDGTLRRLIDQLDSVARFVAERCTVDRDAQVSSADWNAAYAQWCSHTGRTAVSARSAVAMLAERLDVERTRSNGQRILVGVTLRKD